MDMSFMLIGLTVVGFFLIMANMSKGSTDMKKPSRIKSFNAKISSEEAMKIIIRFANMSNYKIDDIDEDKAVIVLSDSATLNHAGNIYPIYITKKSDDSVTIEVGMKNKSIQKFGLSQYHDRCLNGIKGAIYEQS